jgi:predicted outer membrane repeat protein
MSRLLGTSLVVAACAAVAANGQVIFVDADAIGANDGTSWTDAYTHLQNGLTRARQSGQPREIWVADGAYYPDEGTSVTLGDRNATFRLDVDMLALYGGFNGAEAVRGDRDPDVNATILSGDLSGNDASPFVNRGDNSLHVVTFALTNSSHSARLDGFTVRGGNANGAFPNGDGGGMLIPFANAGRANIVGCRFEDNRANSSGGGIYSDSTRVKNIIGCTFEGNSAGSGGGGGFGGNPTNMTVANCLFIANLGGSTGGIGNGGGMAVSGGACAIVNSTFSQNTLQSSAARGGAALALTASNSAPTISNCVFWQNVDGQGFADERAQIDRTNATAPDPTVQFSLVQGLVTAFPGAGNNIDADPLFDVDYRLLAGSPAVDAGDQSLLPADGGDADDDGDTTETLPIDRGGDPRVLCADVDMGAYESAAGGGGLAIICPPNVTLECPATDTSPAVTGDPNATGCGTVTISYSDSVTPGCGGTQTIERTWTADDGSETATCVQVITVADATAPVLTIPAATVLDCAFGSDPNQAGAATATDTCDAAPTVTYADTTTAGTCPFATVLVRTWTATDACGNSVSADQNINLIDETPPSIECPPDMVVTLGSGECAASGLSLGAAVAADTCTGVVVTNDAPTTFLPGQTVVTWTATDGCGNAATCMQLVDVLDATEPFLECSVEETMLWPPNHGMIDVGLLVNVNDDCDSGLPPTITVYANEDDEEATGDGTHSPDALDSLRLRAERKGDGNGRVYLIVVSAEDTAGNVGTSACAVVVPHDRSKNSIQAIMNDAAAALQFFQDNGVPPADYVLVGDGAVVGPNQ